MQTEKITAIYPDSQIQILSGTIQSIDERGYKIESYAGDYTATRAFSCMVEPQMADTVLFSLNARECHILSITERPDSNATTLTFPGDVNFKTSQGQLNIQGQHGVNIVSEKTINLVSEEVSLTAKKALFCIDNLTAIGSTLVSKISHVQTIAHTVETVAEHLLQKLKNSFRQIEGVDQSKVGDAIYTVKNLYSMRSKQAAILAKKDIKIDAERIHMG